MAEPVVVVEQGKLKGKIEELFDGSGKYYAFLGIPYAKPPLGELRFKVSRSCLCVCVCLCAVYIVKL